MGKSEWKFVEMCAQCEKELSENQILYSHGICPYCGYNSNCTICDTKKVVYRKTKTFIPKWYQFWIRPKYLIEYAGTMSETILKKLDNDKL